LEHSRAYRFRRFLNWFPLGLTYAAMYMGRYNFNVVKSKIGGLYHLDIAQMGFIASLGFWTYGLSVAFTGPLADRIGGRKAILYGALGAAALPELPAVHLVWGAVNEWCTQAGYGQLARRAGHPLLGELLRRIMRQEGRHIAFYSSAGRSRLERSGAARRLTRVALERLWRPVGHGVVPAEETRFVVRYLFGDEAGAEAAARIDRNVARLPGLQGLTLVARAVDRCGRAA